MGDFFCTPFRDFCCTYTITFGEATAKGNAQCVWKVHMLKRFALDVCEAVACTPGLLANSGGCVDGCGEDTELCNPMSADKGKKVHFVRILLRHEQLGFGLRSNHVNEAGAPSLRPLHGCAFRTKNFLRASLIRVDDTFCDGQ